MIKDYLQNAHIYYNLSNNLKKGLTWLKKTDLASIEDGKYSIDEDIVYASVQTYLTKDNAKYESHKKYIDIQYMIKGQEKVGISDLRNCITCIEYDSDKDLEFYNLNSEEEFVELSEGQFLIFYPTDAHKPSITKNKETLVKKVVVKVAVE